LAPAQVNAGWDESRRTKQAKDAEALAATVEKLKVEVAEVTEARGGSAMDS